MKSLPIYATLTLVLVIGMNVLAVTPQQNAPAEKEAAHASVVAEHHASSVEAMQLSIDKQKAAVRVQVGEGGVSASFFTTPWVTPQVIVPPPQCAPIAESDLAPLVNEAAMAQEVNPALIRAVIRQESASFPCAISGKGAIGLMQLMSETAQQFGADPYDAKQNVQAGSKYLKQLLAHYKGDTRLALAAYNAGADRVNAAGGIPAIPETTAYVEAILKELESNIGSVSVSPKPE
jgi:soluble lytic murein transglycosylase-like protein